MKDAILKRKLNKSDGIIGLGCNQFVNAGNELHVHLAMLLTGGWCMVLFLLNYVFHQSFLYQKETTILILVTLISMEVFP